jgi:glycosyltransferase involved in cell wall biosynthesis
LRTRQLQTRAPDERMAASFTPSRSGSIEAFASQASGILERLQVSLVAGGTLDHSIRESVEKHARPRIDVLELEQKYGAQLYEFSRLQRTGAMDVRSRAASGVASTFGQTTAALALDVIGCVQSSDVIYTTGEDVGFAMAALLQVFRVGRPALVVRLEEPSYGRTAWRRAVFGLYRHNAMRRIDTLVCRTRAHLQYLHAVERVPMEKLTVVGECVDDTFFSADHGIDIAGLPQDVMKKPYIVTAGLEKRDYATVIDAVRDIPVSLIIGAGSPWSRDAGLPDRALPENVHVSSFSPTQMRALYSSAAFVVVPVKPSLRACGSNVLLEAWAMDKSVVVTRTSGLLDVVIDGQNGLLVEPYDAIGLRTAILWLLHHKDEAARLAANGQRVVRNERNLREYVDRIGHILGEAVAQRSAR